MLNTKWRGAILTATEFRWMRNRQQNGFFGLRNEAILELKDFWHQFV